MNYSRKLELKIHNMRQDGLCFHGVLNKVLEGARKEKLVLLGRIWAALVEAASC